MAENSNITRTLGMLGLAMRAGKVVIGTEQVISFLKKKKLSLVLVSSNASEGTKKKIRFKCEFYKTRTEELTINTDELGRMLGKTYAPAVVGIADENFARTIIGILGEDNA